MNNLLSTDQLNNNHQGYNMSHEEAYIMVIGNRIKKLRKELGLTQDELAAKIKIHGRQLGRYELGRSVPAINTIKKIANFCEVSIDYLIYGQDKKIAKRTKINDPEILDILRRMDNLKKPQRDKIKWAIKSLLNGEKE